MVKITEKINKILKEKTLSRYRLSKLVDYKESSLSRIINGKQTMSTSLIEKIAPILEVSPEEIKGWILADKYPKHVLQRALELKQETDLNEESIFASKIHALMKLNNLNVCAFAETIDYNQGLLSQVILGREPVSDKLMRKLCDFTSLTKDEITSWSVADRASVEALRVSLED